VGIGQKTTPFGGRREQGHEAWGGFDERKRNDTFGIRKKHLGKFTCENASNGTVVGLGGTGGGGPGVNGSPKEGSEKCYGTG